MELVGTTSITMHAYRGADEDYVEQNVEIKNITLCMRVNNTAAGKSVRSISVFTANQRKKRQTSKYCCHAIADWSNRIIT